MTPKAPLKNVVSSVRARLTQRASAAKENVQLALTRFATERLLYRLSLSPHREQFVLKGAMLFSLWTPTPSGNRRSRSSGIWRFSTGTDRRRLS